MLYDLRFAWRALRHRRGATLTAVLCLAIGIGANTTLFGVMDALLFRPPAGVASPEELVRVRIGAAGGPTTTGAGPSMSYPQTRAVAERLAPVADVAVYSPRTFSLGAGEGPEPLAGVIASASYFDVLGVRPYRGRFFAAGEDDTPGAAAVAVLSAAAWNRHFDGDPRAIGSTIEINGVPVTVIGVTPPGFVGVDLGEPDVWLGLGAAGMPELGGPTHFTDRLYWLQMVARRNPGVHVRQDPFDLLLVHVSRRMEIDGLATQPLTRLLTRGGLIGHLQCNDRHECAIQNADVTLMSSPAGHPSARQRPLQEGTASTILRRDCEPHFRAAFPAGVLRRSGGAVSGSGP